MGKKKSLREVLHQHPELFDMVQLLTSGDDMVASEEYVSDELVITLARDGKPKKKKCNELVFVKTAEGYLLRSPLQAEAEPDA
ncbi:hypothetical protein EV700_0662 [Fluviicoccus keumensis]|uniref:Uncharacterized protein n=1 Tax=Fluviicoccus keumensis TaxID=1435465 RepID=A0A4Q7ZCI7_9GAMM|nr:hypothetical protein [Fluviicoccus keumensis]RZU47695.1 hypothetical protein EV700_0662 [Fluviicoccus keumensis]